MSIGGLLADKDCFSLLFELWKSATAPKLVELCGRYHTSPDIILGILDQLQGLGCATKMGRGYGATPFGRSVMSFVEASTKEIGLQPSQAASPSTNILSMQQVLSDIPMASAGTNNSIRPMLSAHISPTSPFLNNKVENAGTVKQESATELFAGKQSTGADATRSYNNL
jgi:hypothetical protein